MPSIVVGLAIRRSTRPPAFRRRLGVLDFDSGAGLGASIGALRLAALESLPSSHYRFRVAAFRLARLRVAGLAVALSVAAFRRGFIT